MQKKLIYILGLALILAAGLVFGAYKTKAYPSFLSPYATATATTSPSYMTAGAATTTLNLFSTAAFDLSDTYDQHQLFIQFTGSSSAATLSWQYEFSNNNVDWYGEDSYITPTTIAGLPRVDHSTTTITHFWNPGTTATSTKTVPFPAYPAFYKRVRFSIPGGGASGAVWAQAESKRLPGTN